MTVDNAGYFCCAIMKQKEIKKYVDTIRGRFVIFCRYHSDSCKMWDQEDRFRRGNRLSLIHICGGIIALVWPFTLAKLGGIFEIYCLLPAFIVSSVLIVVVSLCTEEPSDVMMEEFEKAQQLND